MNIHKDQMMQASNEKQKSTEWYWQQQVNEMKERYGDAANFIKKFPPDLQAYAAQNPERSYLGIAPIIYVLIAGYGFDAVCAWLCTQFEDLNDFSTAKIKMTIARQKEVAKIIVAGYPYLKASEILLFFCRLKSGRYGRFYNSVDAMFVLAALREFIEERKKDLAQIKKHIKKEREQQLQHSRQPEQGKTMSYDEYLDLKAKKEKGETK